MTHLHATATNIYLKLDYRFDGIDYEFEKTIDVVDDAKDLAKILIWVSYRYSFKVATNEDFLSYMEEVIIPNIDWSLMVDNEDFIEECKDFFEDEAREAYEYGE